MAVASMRPLIDGSGTVSVSGNTLTFSAAQAFKEGASVVVDPSGTPQYLTIDGGAGTIWNTIQAGATVVTKTFQRTNDSTIMPAARARGGAKTYLVPNAAHFGYRSQLDEAGNPDYFAYFDTVFPENGFHPYTGDQFAGAAGATALTVQAMIPDGATRLRRIEGALRAHPTVPGTALDPDKRFDTLEAWAQLMATWANGAGHFGSPPAAPATTTYSLQQLQGYADPA